MTGATTSRRGLLVGLALGVPLVVRTACGGCSSTPPTRIRPTWPDGSSARRWSTTWSSCPSALLVGTIGRRFTPSSAWPAVRGGLLASGILALVAWPFVRGGGRDPTNPSLLARDYGAGLAAAVGLAWAAAAAVIVCRWARNRRRGPARVVGRGGTRY